MTKAKNAEKQSSNKLEFGKDLMLLYRENKINKIYI